MKKDRNVVGAIVGYMTYVGEKHWKCVCGNVVMRKALTAREDNANVSCGCKLREQRLKRNAEERERIALAKRKKVSCNTCKHDVTYQQELAGIMCNITPKSDCSGNCMSHEPIVIKPTIKVSRAGIDDNTRRLIREGSDEGFSSRQLSNKFGISAATVCKILKEEF